MIVAENNRPVFIMMDQFDHFGEKMEDGRLTESSCRKTYRLRDAIVQSRKLGRPLSENEMKKFEL